MLALPKLSLSKLALATTFFLLASVRSVVPAAVVAQDPEAKPVLKQSDRDGLAGLFSDYFKYRHENSDLKKLTAALTKLDDDLKKKAKAAKLTSMLDSPVDMRSAMSVPFLENKNLKKGFFFEDKTSVALQSSTFEVGFFYRVPKNYSPKQLYPVIVGLAPRLDKAESVKKWAEAAYPEAISELAVIIVPINVTGTDWTTSDGLYTAMFSLGQALKLYSIDRSRIFVDGQADTAPIVVHYIVRYPSLFTAGILRESAAAPGVDLLANARYVPFLLVATENGAAAKVHGQFAQDCTAAGVTSTTSASPVDASGKPGDPGAAAIVKFLTDTRKVFAPRDIKFTTSTSQSVNAYWLEISKLDVGNGKSVSVEATIDRTSNEIRITAPPQVKEFVIYLNQDVVDMGKEIKVIVTEKTADNPKAATRFQGSKTQSLDLALSLWFENKAANSGEVYTNYVPVTMP